MTDDTKKTRQVVTGGSPKASSTACVATAATVAQGVPPRAPGAWPNLRLRREAASRCEPLECGHQDPEDCTEQCWQPDEPEPEESAPDEIEPEREPVPIARLIAEAKALFLARDHPHYASPAWRQLPPDNPAWLAAVLAAAEMWRKYGDDIADELNHALASTHTLSERATTEACNKAFQELLAQQQQQREAA